MPSFSSLIGKCQPLTLVVTSYSLPNQALRAMLETLDTKHPRGIGLRTGKEFLQTTRSQSNQYRQLSTFLRLRKKKKIHRLKLHRSASSWNSQNLVNQKTWAKTPWKSEASGEELKARCFFSPLSTTLGHFTGERMAKENVWKVKEVQGLPGHEKKQKQMALVVERLIKMEA